MSGPAWERVKAAADGSLGTARLSDLGNEHDVRTLAVALVYGRTGIPSYRAKAADAILSAIGTEVGGLAAVVGRNLISYVLAADLIDLASFDASRDAQFRSWLSAVRTESFSDGSLVSEDRRRANNHGRHAGASRLAASLTLATRRTSLRPWRSSRASSGTEPHTTDSLGTRTSRGRRTRAIPSVLIRQAPQRMGSQSTARYRRKCGAAASPPFHRVSRTTPGVPSNRSSSQLRS